MANPSTERLKQLRDMLAAPKYWGTLSEVPWVDAGGKPKGSTFRQRLGLEDHSLPVGLYVTGYFKPTTIPGNADKLSLTLLYSSARILGLDEDGPSRHFNEVGFGRPYYLKRVEHPQMHSMSDDAIYGYAEPIPAGSFDDHWRLFLLSANIKGAPKITVPASQLPLI